MTLTAVVFAFAALVITLVGAGLLLMFYAAAYAEQAKYEHLQLSDRIRRIIRLMVDDDAL